MKLKLGTRYKRNDGLPFSFGEPYGEFVGRTAQGWPRFDLPGRKTCAVNGTDDGFSQVFGHVVVLSGGMDSTVALYNAVDKLGKENVRAITFNYGSKHNAKEYRCASNTCEELGVLHQRIDLPFVDALFKSDLLISGGGIPDGHYADENMKSTVVPFRNGIMLSIACGLAESWAFDCVVIGNHEGDHAIYPDCTTGFIDSMGLAMRDGTYKQIELISPFNRIRKEDIAVIGDRLGVNWNETYSCYKGDVEHCGTCGTCTERKEAFEIAGIEDPTTYKN